MADKILRFKDVYKKGHPLKFEEMHVTEYRPGEDELTNYRAYRRKRAYGVGTGEGGPVGESYHPEKGTHRKDVTPGYDFKHKTVTDPANPKHKSKVHVIQGETKKESVAVAGTADASASRDTIVKAKKALSQGMPRHKVQAKYNVTTRHLQTKTPPSYGELLKYGRNEETEVEENFNWKVSHAGKDVHVKAPHAGSAVKKAQKGFGNIDLTKAKITNLGKVGTPTREETEVDEALTVAQRLQRKRLFRKFRSKIKRGKELAKRKILSKDKLMVRTRKQVRLALIKKLTKDIPKSELTYQRRVDLEKRLEKPAMKKRIDMLARKQFPKVYKAELAKKRQSKDPK